MISREWKRYTVLENIRIYIYEDIHVGLTYSAKVCSDAKTISKSGFRRLSNARKWAEKEAKKL